MQLRNREKLLQTNKLKKIKPKKSSELKTLSNTLLNTNTECTFPLGSLVWGKLNKCPWWPAIVVDSVTCGMKKCDSSERWIFWFGEGTISKVTQNNLLLFVQNFKNKFVKQNSTKYISAVLEACKEYARKNRYKIYAWSDEEIIRWFSNNFLPTPPLDEDAVYSSCPLLPSYVTQQLALIKSINNKMRKSKEPVKFKWLLAQKRKQLTRSMNNICRPKLNQGVINKVVKGELKIQDICLGCTTTKNQTNYLQPHPLVFGGMCQVCLNHFKETFFIIVDGLQVSCCICGYRSKKSVVCSNESCPRINCLQCINMYIPKDLLQAPRTLCFLCDTSDNNSVIKKKDSWRRNLHELYNVSEKQNLTCSGTSLQKRDVSVLSLYDVTGTVLKILVNLGIDIHSYFFTQADVEICDADSSWKYYAIDLGHKDVIPTNKWSEIGGIDVLIGYIPSNLQPKTRDDQEVSCEEFLSELFINFFYMLNILQERQNNSFFWVFGIEMVVPETLQTTVSRYLEKTPIFQDFTSNSHNLFWTNIPSTRNIMPSIQSVLQPLSCFF